MSGPESNYAAWIEKADDDLLDIENNLAAERTPWGVVCFHAQQAAEKYLKAFLVHRGDQPRRTHDLVALLKMCRRVDPSLESLSEDADRLNAIDTASRYPRELYEPEEKDAREMVEAARRVRSAILALLPRPGE